MESESQSDLVSTAWLPAHVKDDGVRVIDTRKGGAYELGHIPDAVTYPSSTTPFLKDQGGVISADPFAALMSRLDVSRDTTVIAYDDGNNLFAARLWWVLKFYGHRRVKVLDGGWDLWVAEGRTVAQTVALPRPAHFAVNIDDRHIADWKTVKAAIGVPTCGIVDARSDNEWNGFDRMGTKRGGRIPGAIHVEWRTTIDQASKRFKPAPMLREMFAQAGLSPEQEVITYCQAGIRSAHAALALRLAGYERVRNYERSWSEWGNREDLPVEQLQEVSPKAT